MSTKFITSQDYTFTTSAFISNDTTSFNEIKRNENTTRKGKLL